MANRTPPPQSSRDDVAASHPTTDHRAEALNWLAGQYRWEALLADLHELVARRDATARDQERDSTAA